MPSVALTLTPDSTFWTNYTGALTSNNNSASYSQGAGGGVSFYFSTNATTAIPADQIITGVVITIEGYCSPAQPNSITILGNPAFPAVSFTTTETVYTRGSSSDTLGFTGASSLASVGFRFANNGTGSTTFYLDNVTITVYYDNPPVSNNALFFGENF